MNYILYIQSAFAEQISVYSANGVKLYDVKKEQGTTSIDVSNFPKGILFVRGSSGWSKKVILQ